MGSQRKRSLGQEWSDATTGAVNIPRKVGASAHGGLEYHRYVLLDLRLFT